MHAPLIVRAPGIEGGRQTRGLTEFIDIYPSLCELAGLTPPAHLQGESFVNRLRDPDLPGKTAAVGRFRSGDTIRSDRFRFSKYTTPAGQQIAQMLYDHQTDASETENIVDQVDARIVRELAEQLHEIGGVATANALE